MLFYNDIWRLILQNITELEDLLALRLVNKQLNLLTKQYVSRVIISFKLKSSYDLVEVFFPAASTIIINAPLLFTKYHLLHPVVKLRKATRTVRINLARDYYIEMIGLEIYKHNYSVGLFVHQDEYKKYLDLFCEQIKEYHGPISYDLRYFNSMIRCYFGKKDLEFSYSLPDTIQEVYAKAKNLIQYCRLCLEIDYVYPNVIKVSPVPASYRDLIKQVFPNAI